MTGRVCPVHGEWTADGVCRWCPVLPVVEVVTQRNPAATTWRANVKDMVSCRCGEYAWLPGAPGERNGVIAGVAHSPGQCFKLDATPPEPEHTEAFIDADSSAIEESRLLAIHDIARWERVARRWNYKHRGGGGTEEGRAYVWLWWLEQQQKRSETPPNANPRPLGFYVW